MDSVTEPQLHPNLEVGTEYRLPTPIVIKPDVYGTVKTECSALLRSIPFGQLSDAINFLEPKVTELRSQGAGSDNPLVDCHERLTRQYRRELFGYTVETVFDDMWGVVSLKEIWRTHHQDRFGEALSRKIKQVKWMEQLTKDLDPVTDLALNNDLSALMSDECVVIYIAKIAEVEWITDSSADIRFNFYVWPDPDGRTWEGICHDSYLHGFTRNVQLVF